MDVRDVMFLGVGVTLPVAALAIGKLVWGPLEWGLKTWARFRGRVDPIESNEARHALTRLGMQLHTLTVEDGFVVQATLGDRSTVAKGRTLFAAYKQLSHWAQGVK